MPYSNIDKPSKYFEPVLYTGNNANNRTINTTENFQADLFWIKARSTGASHILNDILRSSGYLLSNATSAEGAYSSLSWTNTAPASTGFTIDYGSNGSINGTGTTFVSWCWKANGTGVSNTSGTISSTVSANTTSGFSIVSYTGTGSVATVGHGLGVTPACFITKCRSNSGTSWGMYHQSVGNTAFMELNGTAGKQTNIAYFNNTSPTSSVFTIGTDTINNGSGYTFIAYCFAEVKGFSKFGSYTGNGNADGTFVYTGFKPAFVLLKSSSNSGWHWRLSDNKRDNFNSANNKNLFPSTSDAEVTSEKDVDFLSNGFKLRTNDNGVNTSGWTIIYMAFAENPFVSSKGIPTTAR